MNDDFLVDERKLKDAVDAVHEFIWSVHNVNGSPMRIPLFVNRDYVRELLASVVTSLRRQGTSMHKLEIQQQQELDKVHGEKSVFKHVIERIQ